MPAVPWPSEGGNGTSPQERCRRSPTPRGTHLALTEYGGSGSDASTRWPPFFERPARFLA